MKSIITLTILVVVASSAQVSTAQTQPGSRAVHIVGTNKLGATLSTGNAKERITGRVSINLTSGAEGARKDELTVRGFNVVFFGVSQKLIAPKGCRDEQLGVIGFAAIPGQRQTLHYDARRSQITGQLELFGDASVLTSLLPGRNDNYGDLIATPKLVTFATIRIDLETPVPDRSPGVMTSRARLEISLHSRGARFRNLEVSSFTIASNANSLLNLDLAVERYFEVVRTLCIQPVSIIYFPPWVDPFQPPNFNVEFSGLGLAFGESGARREWEKADVTFDIRRWKSITAGRYLDFEPADKDALLATVDDDDCIEVFFIRSFDPTSETIERGGGTTYGAGACAKIISSDENAVAGIDFTHLAHELGHVLGLEHPDVSPAEEGFYTASTGTLMCKSGFKRDNPRVNSQENKDNLSNPLLVFNLRLAGIDVDCRDSVDCGRCR